MRNLIVVVGLFAAIAGGFYWLKQPKEKVLRICTWSQYLPEQFIQEFEKETGLKVQVNFISSNEELFAKIRAGATGYDLIQPSDYMVERLIQMKLLQPLNHAALSNLARLEPRFRQMPYDPGLTHSVPFIEGTTGIILNREKIKTPAAEISWQLLFNSPDPAHTSLLDDMREVFAAAYIWKGADPNRPDSNTLADAAAALRRAKRTVASFTSEPLALLQRAEVTLAHAFSYQAVEAMRTNPALQYVLPKEGAVQWVDNFVLLASSTHASEAHQFINYVLEPKNTARLQQINHLAIVGSGKSDQEMTEGTPAKLHFFRDLTEGELAQMGQSWTELKSE